MMISPESYYDLYLKNRSPKEILARIRDLQSDIDSQKKRLQPRFWDRDEIVSPSPHTVIDTCRLYLCRAMKAYADAGVIYTASPAELRAWGFDEDIEHIRTLCFTIGGYFGGFETRTVTVNKDSVHLNLEHTPIRKPVQAALPAMPFKTRQEFLDGIRGLYLGEWEPSYVDPHICDGTGWSLDITFDNGHAPFSSSGTNAFPYNFDQLCRLLGNHDFEEA